MPKKSHSWVQVEIAECKRRVQVMEQALKDPTKIEYILRGLSSKKSFSWVPGTPGQLFDWTWDTVDYRIKAPTMIDKLKNRRNPDWTPERKIGFDQAIRMVEDYMKENNIEN